MSTSGQRQKVTPAGCTIVSKNYIAFARTLATSFRRQHPDGLFFVLLVDRLDGFLDREREPFQLIEIEELLNVPDLTSFLFKYSLLEANTAVKPFFLEYLFDKHHLDALVYFDPDILILESLDQLWQRFESSSILLTPHLTDPIEDRAFPGEQAILQAGAYNLGFIGLKRSSETDRFLRWWKDRLYDRCIVRIEDGLFVDQKWIDLVPGLFEGVEIVTDPGYNVAYWNLHGRNIEVSSGEHGRIHATSNTRPLVFFHFSGIEPEAPHEVSKHQDRYTLDDLGAAAKLYLLYRQLLFDNGHRQARPWPYAFSFFDNRVEIPSIARRIYYDLPAARRLGFGDPFATGDRSYFAWLNRPAGAYRRLSRLLRRLYLDRPDLVQSYPDVDGSDYEEFCSWLGEFGRHEFRLDEAFLKGIHRESRSTLLTWPGLKRRLLNRTKRAYHSPTGKKLRRSLKNSIGPERSATLKRRLRQRPLTEDSPPSWREGTSEQLAPVGINIIGYLQAETGMGEAARSLARAASAVGIPHTLHNLDLNVMARSNDRTLDPAGAASSLSDGNGLHDINLLVVNADQIPPVLETVGSGILGGRYTIGFWLWELESFPSVWDRSFDHLHEIWTPSSFCLDAISARSPIPVRKLGLAIAPETPPQLDRSALGIPPSSFLFSFAFNYLSYFERKNPLAPIRAFRRAFADDPSFHLLIKSSHGDFASDRAAQVRAECANESNISLFEEYWDRQHMTALSAHSDCYVSLHRSEGFGLTLAEAMYFGTPVLATPYSGVSDFFHANTGFPVRYKLTNLEQETGPYISGSRWAEPDEIHAAELMRSLVADPTGTAERAKQGRALIHDLYGAETIGQCLRRHLQTVRRRLHGHPKLPAPS